MDDFDLVIVGGTPGGIMAAIAAARAGRRCLLLERTSYVGGLPANGLGATDIATRGATGGLYAEFMARIVAHYTSTFGEHSQQVKDCRHGVRFEPHVAEKVLNAMLQEHASNITVLTRRQFDVDAANVEKHGDRIAAITVIARDTSTAERYRGKVFVDATYEGDLSAAAGVPYRLGRESRAATGEPMAGRVYRKWRDYPLSPGSTGEGDNAIQAYNYRLCLTSDPALRVAIEKPRRYNRAEYIELIDDITRDVSTGHYSGELEWDGIGRVTNMEPLPNAKFDGNHQHLAFHSTDLPEENWPWPTSSWAWRDAYAQRLRDYISGMLWFVQNDDALPKSYRERCRAWGFAKNEYADNGHFPRQVYVREGRRIDGLSRFSAFDALPHAVNGELAIYNDVTPRSVDQPLVEPMPAHRPPVHADSITASHYGIDSHAVRKREQGFESVDGFFNYQTVPYTVPYGVIVPVNVDNLYCPVPVSATHAGFGTLRMEPCWMALGQAAGEAANLCIEQGQSNRDIDVLELQRRLLRNGAVLIYFRDKRGSDDAQLAALRDPETVTSWTSQTT